MALMPTDVRMNEFNVYGPDRLWFREERRGDSLREQLALRLGRQEAHLRGQRPARTVARRRRGRDRALELGAGKTLASPLLPGFGLRAGQLFRR
jgi:hypothetical protein